MFVLFGSQNSYFILFEELDLAEYPSFLIVEFGEFSGLLLELPYGQGSFAVYAFYLIVILFGF